MGSWWDEVYAGAREKIPWDIGVPSEHLVDAVEEEEIKPGAALDICCGTGTEAIYLAQKGFSVSAIDVSRRAIEIARKKAIEAGVKIDFRVGSILEMPFEDESFDLVNDRGCFHVFAPEYRKWFVEEVGRVMRKGGIYLLRCFSEKEPEGPGPRRISREELLNTFSGAFEITSIDEIELRGRNTRHRGYRCMMKRLKI